jgi:RNA polymerase primary sigma factor
MPTNEPLPTEPPEGIVDPLKHQGLVAWVAKHYLDRGLDLEDLKQEGQFGLLEACQRFDPERGKAFATYAPHWIRESIRQALDAQARPMRIPSYLRKQIRRGYTADTPGLTVKERANLRAALFVLMGECSGAVELFEVAAKAEGAQGMTADRVVELADQFAKLVAPRLAALTDRERSVIVHSFGLYETPPLMPHEIARVLGLSRQRINQLYGVALGKLRVALRGAEERNG